MAIRPIFTIHGCRGSFPVLGPQYRVYGGHTTCLSIETGRGLVIIDAGTGIASAARRLMARRKRLPITILFTHFHLDHIIGLPSFTPLLRPGSVITVMASRRVFGDWRGILRTFGREPFWPVNLLDGSGRVRMADLPAGALDLYGITIRHCANRHPQGGLSYRVESPGRTIVVATDRELGDPERDAEFLRFAGGADVLIHDGQYTPMEYRARRGWGHSTWKDAARVARRLGVTELVLTSHDPDRTDAAVNALVRQARRIFPRTRAARCGMRLAG